MRDPLLYARAQEISRRGAMPTRTKATATFHFHFRHRRPAAATQRAGWIRMRERERGAHQWPPRPSSFRGRSNPV